MPFSRRTMFKGLAAGAVSLPLSRADGAEPAQAARVPEGLHARGQPRTGKGFEGQRRADRGDRTYLNPIIAGDHPDPLPAAGFPLPRDRCGLSRFRWTQKAANGT